MGLGDEYEDDFNVMNVPADIPVTVKSISSDEWWSLMNGEAFLSTLQGVIGSFEMTLRSEFKNLKTFWGQMSSTYMTEEQVAFPNFI